MSGTERAPKSTWLSAAVQRGVIADEDVAFVAMFERRFGATDEAGRAAAALATSMARSGHVCVDLADHAGRALDADAEESAAERTLRWPEQAAMEEALAAWAAATSAAAEADAHPLVLQGSRLYLSRYFAYERRLADALNARLASPPPPLDAAAIRARLAALCDETGEAFDGQRVAVAAALRSRLSLIVGGPGTGKTTTVLKLLAALALEARDAGRRAPRVAMLAPTGKAAARMGEAVRVGLERLRAAGSLNDDALDCVARSVEVTPSTIHRALGFQPADPTRFRHRAENPLPADVVVLDEASMVDIALMTRLVEAVSPDARLVMLGDDSQLASVEVGSVLGDLVAGLAVSPGYSEAFARDVASWMPSLPALPTDPNALPIRDAVVKLTYSHRFADGGGIGQLARAIEQADPAHVMEVLRDEEGAPEVRFVDIQKTKRNALAAEYAAAYAPLFAADDPEAALAALGRVQVLCAHRRGPSGVEAWNASLEQALAKAHGLQPRGNGDPYTRRPVLVTTNEPSVRLYNGDVGVTLPDGDEGHSVWFAAEGGPRSLSARRLPAHETVFAMTVHKSQGSEFDEVVVVLPKEPSALTTRELLYTGVTRAKAKVTVVGSANTIEVAVKTGVQRASGLRARLWEREAR